MKDYIIRGIDKNKKFKFAGVQSTNLVNEICKKHETSATASAALGRTLSAGMLMSTMLKNEKDTMTITIFGGGSIGKIVVTVKNDGEIKGYVDNPKADLPLNKNNKLDVSGIVGNNGYFQVVIDMGLKTPYVGKSELISGEIAEDVANYYLKSEQVNSAVALGVLIDKDLSIINSGGYLIQLLPDAKDEDIDILEKNILSKGSFTELLKEKGSIEEVMQYILEDFDIEILEKSEFKFKCNCSKERISEMFKLIQKNELNSIIEEDNGAEVVCQFCNSKYKFSKEELIKIRDR